MNELIPISIFLGAFAMVFGIRYLSSKEKMAMIERGLNPGIGKSSPKPFLSLKFGLLLVGLGVGLLVALFIVRGVGLTEDESAAVYFGCVGVFGGFGLIISYVIEKRWLDKESEPVVV